MPGTKQGGINASNTNRRLYGSGFYARIGRLGGAVKVPKGFALNKALAREAGRKGGKISRRGAAK